MAGFSGRRRDLFPKAKFRGRREETLRPLKKCLHVSSLHVRAVERIFAIPLFDEQQSMWIIYIFLETYPMTGCLIGNDRSDDGRKVAARVVDFIGLDKPILKQLTHADP
jgi:hypothetical protein